MFTSSAVGVNIYYAGTETAIRLRRYVRV